MSGKARVQYHDLVLVTKLELRQPSTASPTDLRRVIRTVVLERAVRTPFPPTQEVLYRLDGEKVARRVGRLEFTEGELAVRGYIDDFETFTPARLSEELQNLTAAGWKVVRDVF